MDVKNGDPKKKKYQTRKNMKEEGRKEESRMFNNALVAAKIN